MENKIVSKHSTVRFIAPVAFKSLNYDPARHQASLDLCCKSACSSHC